MRYTYRYRSFFWPALLILAGVVALLVNTGQIPVERLAQIIDLWPLILVVIGLELIVRRTVHGVAGDVAAALIVLLAIGGAAAYVAVGPAPSAMHALDASDEVGGLTAATAVIDAAGRRSSSTAPRRSAPTCSVRTSTTGDRSLRCGSIARRGGW